MQSTLEHTTRIVATVLRRDPAELPPGRPLLDEGLLDSLQVVELADAIESHFAVRLGPFDLSPEHFGSIGRLAALIDAKLASTELDVPGLSTRRAI